MKDELPAHAHDILEAIRQLREFVAGRTFADYSSDAMLRSAVERKFEIMGEALTRVRRDDPEVFAAIRHHREIVSFRNILIHGYDSIDDRIVWDVIKEDLDSLAEDVKKLIA